MGMGMLLETPLAVFGMGMGITLITSKLFLCIGLGVDSGLVKDKNSVNVVGMGTGIVVGWTHAYWQDLEHKHGPRDTHGQGQGQGYRHGHGL